VNESIWSLIDSPIFHQTLLSKNCKCGELICYSAFNHIGWSFAVNIWASVHRSSLLSWPLHNLIFLDKHFTKSLNFIFLCCCPYCFFCSMSCPHLCCHSHHICQLVTNLQVAIIENKVSLVMLKHLICEEFQVYGYMRWVELSCGQHTKMIKSLMVISFSWLGHCHMDHSSAESNPCICSLCSL